MTNPSNEAILFAQALMGVLAPCGRPQAGRLVDVRGQWVVAQVEQLELGVDAARCHVVDPSGDLLAVAVGAGAAENGSDPDHTPISLFWFCCAERPMVGCSIRGTKARSRCARLFAGLGV